MTRHFLAAACLAALGLPFAACAGVSAGRIRSCRTFEEAREKTRATTGCGGCVSVVKELIEAAHLTV